MEIISHRYLLNGKNSKSENTLTQLKKTVRYFNFFETDIRRLPSGEFYISHNPQNKLTGENDAREHIKIWKEKSCQIALNIKELGYEQDLVEFLKAWGVLKNVFLFDFDIEFLGADLQSYINQIHQLAPELKCAVRVSNHNETVLRALATKESTIIWLDEFESFWSKQQDFRDLKQDGRVVYCVSPDLHGFTLEESQKRWQDFLSWQADGICTNYPLLLKESLSK